jgi:FkbH-like protein
MNSARVEIMKSLECVLGSTPGIAVIHSSIASIGTSSHFSHWDFLYAFNVFVKRGWTFAFPTFTFSFTETGIFNPLLTKSETGLLGQWVLDQVVGSVRTNDPIYSFAIIGPETDRFANAKAETVWGTNSTFEIMETLNASVVMLGCGWEYCTSFHRFEEEAKVPYRSYKKFEGVLLADHEKHIECIMYVRDQKINAQNNFSSIVEKLRKSNKINETNLWQANIQVCNMKEIACAAKELLKDDLFAFVENKVEVKFKLDCNIEAEQNATTKVALLGSSNLEILKDRLEQRLVELVPERSFSIYSNPFGQFTQQLIDKDSKLQNFFPDLSIFADRIEDIFGKTFSDPKMYADIVQGVEDYIQSILRFSNINNSKVLVHKFNILHRTNFEDSSRQSSLVEHCNRLLEDAFSNNPNIFLLDIGGEVSKSNSVLDPRLWFLGRIPFSESFSNNLVNRWAGILMSLIGKTSRLIVLDLDNTLWGGVLGEDGETGIALGGDYPGNVFQEFQKCLKSLSGKGIAIAVCSKNDEDLALKTIRSHQSMILRESDIVAHKINWEPKWINIHEIANELDLGLGSILFIDDNPVEQEAIKKNLPMVKVLELPSDPASYLEALNSSPYLEVLRSGAEDLKRIKSYKARRQIKIEQNSAASMEEFLASLNMTLKISPLNSSNLWRAAQLCQKTNQFNTTSRRYSEQELIDMVTGGCDVAVVGLEDKYTEMENIGLVVLIRDQLNNDVGRIALFLLSCRVLGRDVEKAVLLWTQNRAQSLGWKHLVGELIETPRNTPSRNLFEKNGFVFCPDVGMWQIELKSAPMPKYFNFEDGYQLEGAGTWH